LGDVETGDEEYLYDPNVVQSLVFTPGEGAKFNPQLSPKNPGSGLSVRPLSNKDFERGKKKVI